MPTEKDLVVEARELLYAINELPPWFVGDDDGNDCPNHARSGLAVVDTGRADDWPIARHCHWPVARFIARAPELLRQLCDEVERLRAQLNDPCLVAGYHVCGGKHDLSDPWKG